MTGQRDTKHEEKSNMHPVAAAVTAAVVGAGVATIGAVALSNKKNREKVKEVLVHAKDQAVGYIENLQKQAEDKESGMEKKLADGKKVLKHAKKA